MSYNKDLIVKSTIKEEGKKKSSKRRRKKETNKQTNKANSLKERYGQIKIVIALRQ